MNSSLQQEVFPHAQISRQPHQLACVVCSGLTAFFGTPADSTEVNFLQRYSILADAAGYHVAPLCRHCRELIAQCQEFERQLLFNIRTLKDKRMLLLGAGTGEFEPTGNKESHRQVCDVNMVDTLVCFASSVMMYFFFSSQNFCFSNFCRKVL
jgi:hypothetical protein